MRASFFARMFDLLFGCGHEAMGWPIARRQSPRERGPRQAYIVCLDCGDEFEYCEAAMRVGRKLRPALPRHPDRVLLARQAGDERRSQVERRSLWTL